MPILTAQEMAEADRRSAEAGIGLDTLMAAAGKAVAAFALERFAAARTIVVLCGKGNNGGDGMVAAEHLAAAGREVRVTLLGQANELRPELQAIWQLAGGERVEIADAVNLADALAGAELVIDAIVGTGFHPPLRGLALEAQRLLAVSRVPVLAVDLPSGWDADSTHEHEDACRADAVVTFTAPKLAHIFGELTAPNVFGPVLVAPIGTPEDLVQSVGKLTWTGASKAITEPPRDANGNKGRFGHVLIVGGAVGKAGAPSMASLACMRAGAGLVTAGVVADILPTVAAIAPELMLTAITADARQTEPAALAKLLKGIKVVGIGPGLGTETATVEFVHRFVSECTLPMVIDADALNALALEPALLGRITANAKALGQPRTIVLTPHPGEMARLTGCTVKDVEADRIGIARRFATEHGITLVLKGWRTLVAHPDGRIAVNTTGNPAMAKGGSGDILTGIVSALVAQHPENIAAAVEAAVFLHGLAGDFAALAQDQHTVLATDTVHHLWQAFRARAVDADGRAWITGLAAR